MITTKDSKFIGVSFAVLAGESIHLNYNDALVIQIMNNNKQATQSLNQRYHPRKLRYARLLLQLYHSEGKESEDTVGEFVTQYGATLTPPFHYRSKVQQQLQIGQYKHLKTSLQAMTQQAKENVFKLQQLNLSKYSEIKKIMALKQQTCLLNFQARLASFTPTLNEGEDQLKRIKKVIENGVWGCLNRLNERLSKLRQLQSDK